MADFLFYRFVDDTVEWLAFDSSGRVISQSRGTLETLAEEYSEFEGEAVCVVPSKDVLLTKANVPSRQYRQILQAVPYVVEESLATDVEQCFFALGDRNDRGDVAVAVVDHELLKRWIETVSALPFITTTMVSQSALVPLADHPYGIVDADQICLAVEPGEGVMLPLGELPMALSFTADAEKLTIETSDQSAIQLQLSELEASEIDVEVIEHEDSDFFRFARVYDGSQINLLQGEHKVEVKRSTKGFVWRSVAGLVAVAFFLHLALTTGQAWFLSQKAEEYESAARALYQQTFPDDRNVRDIRRRWNSHLGNSGTDEGSVFLGLFAQASQNINGSGLTLDNVNYNESRGDLILQVIGPRSEDLVQFTQQLTEKGLAAEIGTISQEDEGVRGSIKISNGERS